MLLALQSAEIPVDGEFSRILAEARNATEAGDADRHHAVPHENDEEHDRRR